MLTMERGLPGGLHDFVNEMKQLYTSELVYLKCKPVFSHQYALAQLRSAGYRLALASNSIRATVDLMLSRACLASYFDVTLSNEDVSRPKPHPEIYQTAIARLNLDPAQCLVLEDNFNGIKAAERSGAHVMVVDSVHDVSYDAIHREICRVEGGVS
jgi:HAD superfamily hydrolase (TIGR01509 family)